MNLLIKRFEVSIQSQPLHLLLNELLLVLLLLSHYNIFLSTWWLIHKVFGRLHTDYVVFRGFAIAIVGLKGVLDAGFGLGEEGNLGQRVLEFSLLLTFSVEKEITTVLAKAIRELFLTYKTTQTHSKLLNLLGLRVHEVGLGFLEFGTAAFKG